MANPDWLDLSDQRVVVLGAGAEMGPLRSMLSWGGEVVGVDLPRPDIWKRVLDVAGGVAPAPCTCRWRPTRRGRPATSPPTPEPTCCTASRPSPTGSPRWTARSCSATTCMPTAPRTCASPPPSTPSASS